MSELKRYELAGKFSDSASLREFDEGRYVKFVDILPLIEALKFYANRNNHNKSIEFSVEKGLNDPKIGHFVNADDFDYYDYCFTPGKLARQVLKSIGEV